MPDPTPRAAGLAANETPASLRWAVRLLLAQAVALAGLVVFLIYQDVAAPASSARNAGLVTVYAALMAAILGLLALALRRRSGWARGPAIVLQLLLLPLGYTMVNGGLPALGVPVMLVGLCGAGALLAPATRAALNLR